MVVKDGARGPLVAVVHRPKYDDWSLPKGKLDPAETWEQAALREVAEEAGVRCELGPELPAVRYRDRHGREKLVRWWQMRAIEDEGFTPSDEIDALRWLSPGHAVELLDYEHDRDLVRAVTRADRLERTSS